MTYPLTYTLSTDVYVHIPKQLITIKLKEMNPTVIILCGIPASGKSTWTEEYIKSHMYGGRSDFRTPRSLSRDHIRQVIFGKKYKQNRDSEQIVTQEYDKIFEKLISFKMNIVLDNTHCREAYIQETLKKFENTNYKIQIKFFDLPLWKAYYRNIKRRLTTGKWIPVKVIKAMKTNYDKINKTKYEHYRLE